MLSGPSNISCIHWTNYIIIQVSDLFFMSLFNLRGRVKHYSNASLLHQQEIKHIYDNCVTLSYDYIIGLHSFNF
jgi:hypothetical protein